MFAAGQASALCASHEAYDSIAIAICVVATDEMLGSISYANPAFTRITGIDAQDARGKILFALHDPSSDGSALQQLRTALHQGKAFEGEWLIRCVDGESRWVRVSFAASHAKGAPVAVTLQDIGE